MTPNTNPQTGIPYGVASANGFAELASDIMTHGKDLTLADWEDEISAKVTGVLDDFEAEEVAVDPGVDRRDAFEEFWFHALVAVLDLSNKQARKVAALVADLTDMDSFTFSIGEVHGEIMQYLQENDYFCNDGMDGHEYEYSSGGIEYRMGTLGGAYLIWVCKSKYGTYARDTSICVPGAVDLDNPTDGNSGRFAYCFDPEEYNEDNRDIWPCRIFLVKEDGTPGECVWSTSGDEKWSCA
jgi:hypothetical protein